MDAQKITHFRIRAGLRDPERPRELPEPVFFEAVKTDVDTGASLRDVSH